MFKRNALGLASVLLAAFCIIAPVEAIEIKVATVAPDGSGWMRAMRVGAAEIRDRTHGRVTIKFYPGGVMGNDAQVLRKIRVGQLHGGAFTGSGIAERYAGFNLYGIPLLFRSLDEVDYVRARMDAELEAGLADAGFISFGLIEGGFALMMSNEPVSRVEDMRRRKVWSPEGAADRCAHRLADGTTRCRRRITGSRSGAAVAHQGEVRHRSAGGLRSRCFRDRRSRIQWLVHC